jgi:hypothetical protein
MPVVYYAALNESLSKDPGRLFGLPAGLRRTPCRGIQGPRALSPSPSLGFLACWSAGAGESWHGPCREY